MAAEHSGDISPGCGGRSSSPSHSNNGAGESGANAGAELGVAASNTTRGDADNSESEEVLEISYEPDSLGKRGTVRYTGGDVYEGELEDGERHGTGVYRFADGGFYDGEWQDGEQHGRGTMTYKNGNVYEGEWAEGKRRGKGFCRYADGGVYDGEWEENEIRGFGTYTWACGDVYEGRWLDGAEHGKGTWKGKNGDVYDGEWKGKKYHGEGTLKYASGSVYEGQWSEGKEHGKGTLKFSSGDVYEGQWVEGKRHGKFTWKGSKGGLCEQVWVNGRQTEGKRFKRKARGPSPAVDGATTNPEVVGGANLQAPTSSRPQVRTCDQNDGGEEVESKAKFGGATEEQQPEKEKRVYNHERKLRSQRSQQRRLHAAKKTCDHCGVDDYQYKLRVCSGCNLAFYCSAACQKAASRSHQRICNIISELPSRDAERLVLNYDKDKMVDLDAGLRYATKYMDNLKHLQINLMPMERGAVAKLSAKYLCSLLKSKRGALESVSWLSNEYVSASRDINRVWRELHDLKQLRLYNMKFDDVQSLYDIIGQQKDTLMVLCLPFLHIDWHKAKCRRSLAQAVSSCKHLVKLDLTGWSLMDSDVKVLLHDLPNLRTLHLMRDTGIHGQQA